LLLIFTGTHTFNLFGYRHLLKKAGFRHSPGNVLIHVELVTATVPTLLEANYDIRTIQELLGHSDIRTTMIYTRAIKSQAIKEAKSPLDF
jgi:site-specific recombinase XerD